jgi:uncharacterized protein YcfL
VGKESSGHRRESKKTPWDIGSISAALVKQDFTVKTYAGTKYRFYKYDADGLSLDRAHYI